MDAEQIKPLLEKHSRAMARQMFWFGVLLGVLAGFGFGFMLGQDTAERKIIVLSGQGQKA